MANYLVFPDDAEQGVAKHFSNLKRAVTYAVALAGKRNMNVRVWRENLKTGIMERVYTVNWMYSRKKNPGILDTIRPGMRVTIVDRFGKERSGKAVMRGPAGWVLNMGGPHGTPGIATPENIVKVSGKPSARSLFGSRIMNPTGPSAIPTKGMWTVRSWQGDTGQFSTRKAAQQYCNLRREADRQAGNKVDARVVRANPTRTGGPSSIPTKWTPATVSRKGRQIQIRMGGR